MGLLRHLSYPYDGYVKNLKLPILCICKNAGFPQNSTGSSVSKWEG